MNLVFFSRCQYVVLPWLVAALRNPPKVTDVKPEYGPASGNTVVTVSGMRLNSVQLRYVHYGSKYKWQVIDNR